MRRRGVTDVTAPASRHNLHVTRRDDLEATGPWSTETLYRAVKRADEGESDVVVLDYARSNLYLAASSKLTYTPPKGLGFAAPPALAVVDPRRFDPDALTTEPHDSVTVSPEFDILVPAFDWEELSEDDILPPMDTRRTPAPTGTQTGTSG